MYRVSAPFVAISKQKAVISARKEHLEEIGTLVRGGRYRTVSEFVREAVAEKLERLRRVRLTEQVARYCDEVSRGEDAELISWQAFDERPARKARRAKR